LQGHRGIIQLLSLFPRSETKADIVLEYCNSGSVQAISRGEFCLEDKELLPVMYDLLMGLKSIHSLGYIHRDLQPHNVMLHRENGRLCGVINDLGSAVKLEGKYPTLLPTIRGCSRSPEGLLRGIIPIDPRISEMYYLGMSFYIMAFHEFPSWANLYAQKEVPKFSKSYKLHLHQTIEEKYSKDRKEFLRNKESESVRREAGITAYKILQPNPNHRLTLDETIVAVEEAAKKWNINLE
ncbi:MAG: protein kinase domain-containing protein, partial [Rhabdochlamydiaceae bacterium]